MRVYVRAKTKVKLTTGYGKSESFESGEVREVEFDDEVYAKNAIKSPFFELTEAPITVDTTKSSEPLVVLLPDGEVGLLDVLGEAIAKGRNTVVNGLMSIYGYTKVKANETVDAIEIIKINADDVAAVSVLGADEIPEGVVVGEGAELVGTDDGIAAVEGAIATAEKTDGEVVVKAKVLTWRILAIDSEGVEELVGSFAVRKEAENAVVELKKQSPDFDFIVTKRNPKK